MTVRQYILALLYAELQRRLDLLDGEPEIPYYKKLKRAIRRRMRHIREEYHDVQDGDDVVLQAENNQPPPPPPPPPPDDEP